MTDFLDTRDLDALATPVVMELAGKALLASLIDRNSWQIALQGKFQDEVYIAPEYR
jgi:hypothetical protein